MHTTKNFSDNIKRMSVFGLSMITIGLIWGLIFPINKQLWTSSYVLFTGGIATLVLAILSWVIDVKNLKSYFWVFKVFGTNSIFYLFFQDCGQNYSKSNLILTEIFSLVILIYIKLYLYLWLEK